VKDKLTASRKYACEPCGTLFFDKCNLSIHQKTRKHLDKIEGVEKKLKRPANNAKQLANVASKRHYCGVCDVACRDTAILRIHMATPRHIRKAAAAAATATME